MRQNSSRVPDERREPTPEPRGATARTRGWLFLGPGLFRVLVLAGTRFARPRVSRTSDGEPKIRDPGAPRQVAPMLRFTTLALGPGSRSARLRLAALARDTRVRSGLACPGRATAKPERRSGTQGRQGRSRRYCASRLLRWVPGLVPLGYASLHSPGTREFAPASRVPDERRRSRSEDPGPRGARAGRADTALRDFCAGSRVSFRFATLARDTRVRSAPGATRHGGRYFPRCLSKKRAISLKASFVSGA